MTNQWEQEAHDFFEGKSFDYINNTYHALESQRQKAFEEFQSATETHMANNDSQSQQDLDLAAEKLERVETYQRTAFELMQQQRPDLFEDQYAQEVQQVEQQPGKIRKWPKRVAYTLVAAASVVYLGNKFQNEEKALQERDRNFTPTTVEPLTQEELENEFCELDYGMGGALADGTLWESKGNRAQAESLLRDQLSVYEDERNGCDSEAVERAVEEGLEQIDATIANYGLSDVQGSRSLISCEEGVVTDVESFGKPTDIRKGANCPVNGLSPGEIAQTLDGTGVVLDRGL